MTKHQPTSRLLSGDHVHRDTQLRKITYLDSARGRVVWVFTTEERKYSAPAYDWLAADITGAVTMLDSAVQVLNERHDYGRDEFPGLTLVLDQPPGSLWDLYPATVDYLDVLVERGHHVGVRVLLNAPDAATALPTHTRTGELRPWVWLLHSEQQDNPLILDDRECPECETPDLEYTPDHSELVCPGCGYSETVESAQ